MILVFGLDLLISFRINGMFTQEPTDQKLITSYDKMFGDQNTIEDKYKVSDLKVGTYNTNRINF